jgi:hypothetical protein
MPITPQSGRLVECCHGRVFPSLEEVLITCPLRLDLEPYAIHFSRVTFCRPRNLRGLLCSQYFFCASSLPLYGCPSGEGAGDAYSPVFGGYTQKSGCFPGPKVRGDDFSEKLLPACAPHITLTRFHLRTRTKRQ